MWGIAVKALGGLAGGKTVWTAVAVLLAVLLGYCWVLSERLELAQETVKVRTESGAFVSSMLNKQNEALRALAEEAVAREAAAVAAKADADELAARTQALLRAQRPAPVECHAAMEWLAEQGKVLESLQ